MTSDEPRSLQSRNKSTYFYRLIMFENIKGQVAAEKIYLRSDMKCAKRLIKHKRFIIGH